MLTLFAASMQRPQCLIVLGSAIFLAIVLLVLIERDEEPVAPTVAKPPEPEVKP